MRTKTSHYEHQRAVDNMNYTSHARNRMESRSIPEGVVGIILPPFHREVRHLQVVEIVVKNFSMMGCDQGATTPSYWAGRLA